MFTILFISLLAVGFNVATTTLTTTFADDKDCKKNDDNNCNENKKIQKSSPKAECEVDTEIKDHNKNSIVNLLIFNVVVTARALLTAIYDHHHQMTGILVTIYLKLLLSQTTVVVFLP